MKNQKVDTGLGAIVLVIIAITVGAFVWKIIKDRDVTEASQNVVVQPKQVEKNQDSNNNGTLKNSTEKLQADDSKSFQYEKGIGYFGKLELTGHIDIKKHICEPDGMCKKTVDYASLVIISTDNDLVYNFINDNKGNSYVSANSIGLGCYEKDAGRIYSTNAGDNGSFENIISNTDLQRLLNSNKNNPVKLQIIKPVFTSGSGAPECYSHFRSFKILL